MKLDVLVTGPFKVNTILIPISEDRVIIVDPAACSYSKDENKIINYLKLNKLTPIGILLTHGHFDHVSGIIPLINEYPELPIAIHKDDISFLGADNRKSHLACLKHFKFEIFLPYVSNLPNPSFFLEGGKSFTELFVKWKNILELQNWEVINTPGHTLGSVCFFNKIDKVIITGDTLFYLNRGRTDLFGGSELKICDSIRFLKTNISDDVLVYPGHGEFNFSFLDGIER